MSDFTTMLRDGADLYPRLPIKPVVAVRPDGHIAVYIGSAYQYLRLGQAINLRNQLGRAIDERMNQAEAHDVAYRNAARLVQRQSGITADFLREEAKCTRRVAKQWLARMRAEGIIGPVDVHGTYWVSEPMEVAS